METALVRQPRVSPARWRAGREGYGVRSGAAVWLIGIVIAATLAVLPPPAVRHLFPSRLPPDAASARAGLPAATIAAKPTAELPQPAATTLTLSSSLPKPPALPASAIELGRTRELSLPPVAAPVPGTAPTPSPTPPRAAASAIGPPPAPREPLPLQTELLAPGQPGAGPAKRQVPTPAPGSKPRSNEPPAPPRRG